MRYPAISLIAVLVLAQTPTQPPSAQTETSGGLHTVTFNTPAGSVRAYFPDDTAAGDTISGVVVAEPSGNTPEQKDQNLGVLTGTVIEVNQDQKQKVEKDKRVTWVIPTAAGGGIATVLLRSRNGVPIDHAQIPVAPAEPADRSRSFELPTTGNAGRPIEVRGPFDGDSSTTHVTIGGEDAKILAESPRKAIFSSPVTKFGPLTLDVRKGDMHATGQFRNVAIRLSAIKTILIRGQTSTLTITVLGLQGITEPAHVTLTNGSPAVVLLAGGLVQVMEIPPAVVRGDGTWSDTRTLTGVSGGGFNITGFVQRPFAESVNLPRSGARTLDSWQQENHINITSDARRLIASGVLEARSTLDRLARIQALSEGSPDQLIDKLVRHYCFDLRDTKIVPRIARIDVSFAYGFQDPPPAMPDSIDENDVRQRPFPKFASEFNLNVPKSYLDFKSLPNLAVIIIDKNKLGYTDRSAVVPAGQLRIEITLPRGKTCKKHLKLNPGDTAVVSCPSSLGASRAKPKKIIVDVYAANPTPETHLACRRISCSGSIT